MNRNDFIKKSIFGLCAVFVPKIFKPEENKFSKEPISEGTLEYSAIRKFKANSTYWLKIRDYTYNKK